MDGVFECYPETRKRAERVRIDNTIMAACAKICSGDPSCTGFLATPPSSCTLFGSLRDESAIRCHKRGASGVSVKATPRPVGQE